MALPPGTVRRSRLRGLLRLALILVAGILVGFALLVAVFLLPVDRMEQNVLQSIPALDGSWGTGEESYEQIIKGYETTQLDNSTDAYMLLSAIHRSDANPVHRAINVYTYHHEIWFRQFDTLRQFAQTGHQQMLNTTTTRYWLGYLILLKPLLLVFTYLDIRMLNVILQGFMLLGICQLMRRRGLRRYVLPFALSMVCVTPLVTGLSLQFSTSLYVMGASMLGLLWKPDFVKNKLGDAAFFLLTGMATSYFDFLTYPLITFGMPMTLYALMRRGDEPGEMWRCLLRCGGAWCAGYFGMWMGKWVLAALLDNVEFWSSVVGSIEKRTSTEGTGEAISRLDALKRALSVFAKKPYLVVILCVIGGYGAAFLKTKSRREPAPVALCTLLTAIALLPVLWILFMANHTYNHAFYASRMLAVTVFALLCTATRLCQSADETRGHPTRTDDSGK